MKHLALLILLFTLGVSQEKWNVDATHSSVGFTITHMLVSEVDGKFNRFSGTVETKDGSFDGATIKISVDPSSVDTNNDDRDGHLRSPDFFDVKKYDKISLVSKSFKQIKGKKYKLVADLTFHGVTKEVVFDVKHIGSYESGGKALAGFKAEATINRKDFGVTWNKTLDKGGLALSEEVELEIKIELKKA